MELGVFNPIYRNHATKGSRDREPWVDGPEHEAIRRRYIETRYKLLPYIYTGMEEASKTGIPFMRPMFLEFPGNSNVATNDSEFMFGPNLLIAPKVVELVGAYEVQLPGGNWYDFWSGQPVEGESKMVDPPLETLPVYVRAGSILPQQPIVQNLDETPSGPLQISVYPGPDCRGSLYQDDGNSFAYTRGDFYRVQFTCDSRSDALQLNLSSPQGTFNPWWKQLKFVFFGTNNAPRSITVNHKQISDWNFDVEKKTVTMTLSSSRNAVEIQIQK
jgi:alpha-glucosidase